MQDLISRQAAIDALQKEIDKGIPPFDDVMGSIRCGVRLARNIIEDLPPAQPEPKTGRWLDTYNDGDWHCSECGAIVEKDEQIRHYWQRCYHCGARMGR